LLHPEPHGRAAEMTFLDNRQEMPEPL